MGKTTRAEEKALNALDIQGEWAMNYMAANSIGSYPKWFNTGTSYDDGEDFCAEFLERFPGRKPDPNLRNASQRLARLMRRLWEHNRVRRGIQGNEKYLPQEPSWQYVYALFSVDHAKRRATLKASDPTTGDDHG